MGKKRKGKQLPDAVSISAASAITGVEIHTLRFWESEFAEFMGPARTKGGQRRYRPEDIQTVFTVKRLLRDELYSIPGARRHLEIQQRRAA
ncbi:MAG: MerR family transcriptional regulator [Armatimonadetes bacterium]|nr:MerR family transcriptional regulator [Armatimonadota bacterium]